MGLERFRIEQRRIGIPVAAAVTLAVVAGAFGWPRLDHPSRDDIAYAQEPLDPTRARGNEVPPVGEWSRRFQDRQAKGDWEGLDADLRAIEREDRDLYQFYRLGYLHARAALALGRADEARERLAPFLAEGHPLRDLALYHASLAETADENEEEAARLRAELIGGYPEANYRQPAVEAQIAWLGSRKDVEGLRVLGEKVAGDKALARAVEARIVEATIDTDLAGAIARGMKLLRENTGDDSGDRVTRVLDRPDVLDRLTPEDWVLLGESARSHRHYDRAIALLERALPQLPAKRAEMLFAIGRADFHAERYAEAEKRYLEAAEADSPSEAKANALYNAARSAQLRGAEAEALAHLARAITLGKGTSRASSALTQRIRINVKNRRFEPALADLRAVLKQFPRSHAAVEASLAYAVGMVAAGRGPEAVRTLRAVRPKLLTAHDVPEFQYWQARAIERRSPREAVRLYLKVMEADAPTHHFYLARRRIAADPALAAAARAEAAALAAEAGKLAGAGKMEAARDRRTSAYLIAPEADRAGHLEALRRIYEQIPSHRAVLELTAPEFPKLPLFGGSGEELEAPERTDLLLALGLYDDAADQIVKRYELKPLDAAIARAEALRRGLSGRQSVYAAEVAMDLVPEGYRRELLPQVVREVLYPQYFWEEIKARAAEHGADPRLVLSIMREESRFNVRAQSPAAARGLLQFIIGTARQVGEAIGLVEVEPEDLYDPKVIIRLGAKYIGDLQRRFGGDPYKAAAAYNAGPNQAELWSKLIPEEGPDQYIAAVNFDETKNYVRKVMNSYERYRELYGDDTATASR